MKWSALISFLVMLCADALGSVDNIARLPPMVMGTIPADAASGYPGLTYQFTVDKMGKLVAFRIEFDDRKAIDVLSLKGAEALKSQSIDSSRVGFAWTYNRPGGKVPGEDLLISVQFRPYEYCGPHEYRLSHIFRIEEGEITETERCN